MNVEEVQNHLTTILRKISQHDLPNSFQGLHKRCEECVMAGGGVF